MELDHGHAGWDTKIIGALEEVAIAGIEQQICRSEEVLIRSYREPEAR